MMSVEFEKVASVLSKGFCKTAGFTTVPAGEGLSEPFQGHSPPGHKWITSAPFDPQRTYSKRTLNGSSTKLKKMAPMSLPGMNKQAAGFWPLVGGAVLGGMAAPLVTGHMMRDKDIPERKKALAQHLSLIGGGSAGASTALLGAALLSKMRGGKSGDIKKMVRLATRGIPAYAAAAGGTTLAGYASINNPLMTDFEQGGETAMGDEKRRDVMTERALNATTLLGHVLGSVAAKRVI